MTFTHEHTGDCAGREPFLFDEADFPAMRATMIRDGGAEWAEVMDLNFHDQAGNAEWRPVNEVYALDVLDALDADKRTIALHFNSRGEYRVPWCNDNLMGLFHFDWGSERDIPRGEERERIRKSKHPYIAGLRGLIFLRDTTE
jgi:hypothetical protein